MQNDDFERRLGNLTANASLPDYQFPSSVPVLGPFISAFRRFWNNISARWYVQYFMRGQWQFNAAVIDALRYHHDGLEVRWAEMERRLSEQAEQLAALTALCHQQQQEAIWAEKQMQALSAVLPTLSKDGKVQLDAALSHIISTQQRLREQIQFTRALFDNDLAVIVRGMRPHQS